MKNFCLSSMICLFLFSGIMAQRNISGISLVPDGSVAVLRVNWRVVRNDESLKNIVNGNSFAQVAAQIGLTENDVNEWIVFSDISPASAQGLGMIISGKFTSAGVIKEAEAKNWNLKTIGGQKVYVNSVDDSHLLPLGNGLLAVGTKTGMEKVQAAFLKPQNRLIGRRSFSSMFALLESTAPIKFFIGIPQEYQKVADIAFKIVTKLMSFTGFGLLGTIFDKIGLVQSTGFSVSSGKTHLRVQLVAAMPDAARAEIGAGA